MALTPGTRLGPYEILSALGAGGMGEVYRARDPKLNRDVALKVLLSEVADNPERLARFRREAQILASLNHTNIGHIYGLEESRSSGSSDPPITALVMELVEGEDLSQRIAAAHRLSPSAHGLPLDEALPIAKQIAEALEAAHEQGIIHRDLKPANIKVRADGTVKVLDFGLAKAIERSGESGGSGRPGGAAGVYRPDSPDRPDRPDLSQSPTLTSPAMTQAGMILGTAAYMSPEQARGKAVDKRADIWAFGAVLFEMLTGRSPFIGDDVADVLSRVLQREPDLAELPATTPPRIRRLIAKCLVKEPRQRLRDIGDARLALDGAFEASAFQDTTSAASPTLPLRLPWIVLAGVALLAMVAMSVPTARYLRETLPSETRVDIATPTTDQPASFALSPDGRQIVFVASGDGPSRLWLRSLATTAAQPLAGTDGARLPFWSPDGRSIGFFADDTLKRLDLGGGPPQALVTLVSSSVGGTWNSDGVIVYAGNTNPLNRVSATGGASVAVTTLGPQQQGHRQPWFLPDGRKFLFFALGAADTGGIYLGALDGGAAVRLTPADSSGVYLPAGWLLWVRAGMLLAQRLDVARGALTGEPMTLADGVAVDATFSRSAVSVSATGLVAYRTGTGGLRQLTWRDRSGTAQGTIGDPDGSFISPRVSPDGRLVIVNRDVESNRDLWLLDGARATRVTSDVARDEFPVWSPDGSRIVFRSIRSGQFDLYQYTRGKGAEELVLASGQLKVANSWSADGRFLLYSSTDPQTGYDLWFLPMAEPRTPTVFLKTAFMERWGTFSPDGRWVAYVSNESGRNEIYVRAFVPPGSAGAAAGAADGRWQVSTAGGSYPVWRSDGKELYYLNAAGAMMAAPVNVAAGTFETGASTVLFSARIFGGVDLAVGRQYDVAPDGRFLINTVLDNTAPPITLVQNWNPEAKK